MPVSPEKISKEAVLSLDGQTITLHSPFHPELVGDCRAVPGRKWAGISKMNTWPTSSVSGVKSLAQKWNITIPVEILELPDQEGAEYYGISRVGKWVELRFPYNPETTKTLRQMIPTAVWNSAHKRWRVLDTELAKAVGFGTRMGLTFEPGVKEELQNIQQAANRRFEASNALDADIEIESALELRAFQKAGVQYLVDQRRVILGDEMGLGKTPIALTAVNQLKQFPMIVVCSATLKLNWVLEAKKFVPWLTTTVVEGTKSAEIEAADIVIVNYDIIAQRADDILKLHPQSFVADEAHFVKNAKPKFVCPICSAKVKVNSVNCPDCKTRGIAPLEKWSVKRAEGVMKIARAIPADGFVGALTGTPVTNRPSEIVPLLQMIDRLNEFGGRWRFLDRYCPGGSGAENLVELNRKLRQTCMIRRVKKDVYTELPPLQNSVQFMNISNEAMKEYRRIEDDVIEHIAQRAKEIAEEAGIDGDHAYWEKRMRAEAAEHLVRISVLKGAVVDMKYDGVLKWVGEFLENSDEKIILFAERVDIVEKLATHFGDMAVKIRGGVKNADRMEAVRKFQEDPSVRVFIGNMAAAAEGITLTAASNVAFIEQAWTPATHAQCAARCYGRVGDLHGAMAYYLLVPGTIDEDINTLLTKKAKIVDAVTDGVEVEKQGSILADLVVSLAERGMNANG